MDKHKTLKLAAKVALFAVPFILGYIGFSDLYEDFWSRVYHTMALYALNFDAPEEYLRAHACLQVARLLAGVATFSIVIALVNNFWSSLSDFIQIICFKAIVVHGEGDQADRIIEGVKDSGATAIRYNSKACFKARNQVLAFETDAEALRYIESHLQDFFPGGSGSGSRNNIVLCSNMYSNCECKREYFSVYNPAETCARLYWKDHWLDRERFTESSGKLPVKSVAIIGFDHFGEQILDQALIMNVTDRQLELTEKDRPYVGAYWDQLKDLQGVHYYVIGSDGAEYCAMHPMLSEFLNLNGVDGGHRDSLTFYASLSDMGIRMLDSIDLIIIALDDPEACLEMMNRIVCAGVADDIHIHCGNEEILYSLYQTATKGLTMIPFGMNRDLFNRENLLHEQMEQSAKDMNFNYVKGTLTEPLPRDREEKMRDESWRSLTYFQKLSNFASCDHNAIKEGLLKKYPFTENADTDTANLLMEIEHTRWERFYWLHNWEYNPERNDAKHLHPSLVPFPELDRKVQLRDYDMYRKIAGEIKQ